MIPMRIVSAIAPKKIITRFRKTRRRNKIFIILGILFLLLFIGGQVSRSLAPSPYITDHAKNATIVQQVSETGNVNAAGRVDVYSSTTGVVEELYVKNGQNVTPDQELFRVRSTATDQEKATAYANYQTALSNLKTAQQNKGTYDAQMWAAQQALLEARNTVNYKNDHTKNPATGNDYTQLEKESIDTSAVQAEKNFHALEKRVLESDSAISAAQASVTSTLLAYQATVDVVVKAPSSGTVTNLSTSVGDRVTANAQTPLAVTPATPVLTLVHLGNYTIAVSLNEVDVPKVKEGQKAEITIDAFPGQTFAGRVNHVDEVGTDTQGVVTYTVIVKILNPRENIKPGMTANVDIEVDKAVDVLSVPNSAVKPYKGGRAVRIENKKTKKIEYISVKVGIKGDERTQILKGLTRGQEVIVSLPNDQIKRQSLF